MAIGFDNNSSGFFSSKEKKTDEEKKAQGGELTGTQALAGSTLQGTQSTLADANPVQQTTQDPNSPLKTATSIGASAGGAIAGMKQAPKQSSEGKRLAGLKKTIEANTGGAQALAGKIKTDLAQQQATVGANIEAKNAEIAQTSQAAIDKANKDAELAAAIESNDTTALQTFADQGYGAGGAGIDYVAPTVDTSSVEQEMSDFSEDVAGMSTDAGRMKKLQEYVNPGNLASKYTAGQNQLDQFILGTATGELSDINKLAIDKSIAGIDPNVAIKQGEAKAKLSALDFGALTQKNIDTLSARKAERQAYNDKVSKFGNFIDANEAASIGDPTLANKYIGDAELKTFSTKMDKMISEDELKRLNLLTGITGTPEQLSTIGLDPAKAAEYAAGFKTTQELMAKKNKQAGEAQVAKESEFQAKLNEAYMQQAMMQAEEADIKKQLNDLNKMIGKNDISLYGVGATELKSSLMKRYDELKKAPSVVHETLRDFGRSKGVSGEEAEYYRQKGLDYTRQYGDVIQEAKTRDSRFKPEMQQLRDLVAYNSALTYRPPQDLIDAAVNAGQKSDMGMISYTPEQQAELDKHWEKSVGMSKADYNAMLDRYKKSGVTGGKLSKEEIKQGKPHSDFYKMGAALNPGSYKDKSYYQDLINNILNPPNVKKK